MGFNNLKKYLNPMSQEEMETLAEPSIMDEYIKQNDPEQWDKIERAKQTKFAIDSAMNSGPAIGSIEKLAMDKVSRLARAKEMGFNVEKPLYHGTSQNIPEFNPDLNGKHTLFPAQVGHYFTDNPEIAAGYAKNKGGNIIPSYLKQSNPLIVEGNGNSIPLDHRPFIDKALDNGHDSIVFKNVIDNYNKPSNVHIVIKPEQIRSVNADFNPEFSSSGDILKYKGGRTSTFLKIKDKLK